MAGCPSCGAVPASPDSRFCDRCGSPLGAASGAAGQGAQARKVVTVLFADLVGSTATQEGMDPESVRRWLDRYYAVVRGEIEGRGGRVVKFIGDGVMAVFGVPEVREDDADRAVAAARAMQGAVAELGGPGGAPGVGLRVGVNTGEVVVTADDDDVVGDVVNVAARLEQAARPGEVLVGEATFRLVRTRAQLRAVAPLELKGKSEPVPAFLLQSLERTEEDA
jgi:class 3 adenylate cyclase